MEYRGKLPEACENELESAGTLRIIQSKNQLYSIEMRFINSKPILMRYFAPNTISRMEVAFKKSGYAGSSFLSHINSNLMLNYFITRDGNRNIIEKLLISLGRLRIMSNFKNTLSLSLYC